MILFIDNYDSFTFNLVQYVGETGEELTVSRPNKITLDEIREMKPDRIILSPGPGHPKDAALSLDIIREFMDTTPILGVCLGHQCIAHAFGAEVHEADRLVHGKISPIYHHNRGVLEGIASPFDATRYHSLVVNEDSLPDELEVTAYTSDGEIMGLIHRDHPLYGLQFHPESILTKTGKKIIRNFLEIRP